VRIILVMLSAKKARPGQGLGWSGKARHALKGCGWRWSSRILPYRVRFRATPPLNNPPPSRPWPWALLSWVPTLSACAPRSPSAVLGGLRVEGHTYIFQGWIGAAGHHPPPATHHTGAILFLARQGCQEKKSAQNQRLMATTRYCGSGGHPEPQYIVVGVISPWEILSFVAGRWSATFQGTLVRWVDGDTADVDISFTWVTIHARLRLARVNAAELVTSEGLRALSEMQKAFPPGSVVTVHVYDRDRYQRLLGDILLDGRSASEYLKSAGLG
jgi:hypothetical protein